MVPYHTTSQIEKVNKNTCGSVGAIQETLWFGMRAKIQRNAEFFNKKKYTKI